MPHLTIAVWGCCDVVRPLRRCSWLWGSGCPDLTIVGLRYTLPGASDVFVYCVWRVALPHLPLGVQSQVRRHPIAVAMWTFVSGEGRCRLCGRSFKWGYLQPLAVGTCLSYQGDLGWHIQRTTSIHSFWWRRSVRLGVARIPMPTLASSPLGGADAAGWRGTAGQLLSRW